jgi:hypothetical protein
MCVEQNYEAHGCRSTLSGVEVNYCGRLSEECNEQQLMTAGVHAADHMSVAASKALQVALASRCSTVTVRTSSLDRAPLSTVRYSATRTWRAEQGHPGAPSWLTSPTARTSPTYTAQQPEHDSPCSEFLTGDGTVVWTLPALFESLHSEYTPGRT